jgi:hypothetical protein
MIYFYWRMVHIFRLFVGEEGATTQVNQSLEISVVEGGMK